MPPTTDARTVAFGIATGGLIVLETSLASEPVGMGISMTEDWKRRPLLSAPANRLGCTGIRKAIYTIAIQNTSVSAEEDSHNLMSNPLAFGAATPTEAVSGLAVRTVAAIDFGTFPKSSSTWKVVG